MKTIFKIKNARSMIRKEFKQLFRDPKMRLVLIVPQIAMLFVFGYAVNMDVTSVKTAVLDEDNSQRSREFIGRFTASPYFLHYAQIYTPVRGVTMLDRGEIDLFMHVKAGFSENIKNGRTTGVQIIIDGANSSRASTINSYIKMVTYDFIRTSLREKIRLTAMYTGAAGRSMPGPITLEPRMFFNQEMKSINFFLPGVIGLIISLITIMLTSMSIVKEREAGTIEQINVSPLHPFEFILGKMMPFAAIAFFETALISILAILWFNIPFKGNFIFLMFCASVYIISSLGVGLYISTISSTQQQTMLSSFLFFIPAVLFSGFIFPIYSMPPVIQALTYLNPMRYLMTILRGVFLKGLGFATLWQDIAAMAVLGVLLLSLSVKKYSKRVA